MRENSTCWIDENGNMWEKNKYSMEYACKLSKTLVNCKMCLNCYDLRNCHSCKFCNSCSDCVECFGCSETTNSLGCRYCHNCIKCFYCIECKECENCKSCGDCNSCIDCQECRESNDLCLCKRCDLCHDLKSCEDLKRCDGFKSDPEKYSFVISDISYCVCDDIEACGGGSHSTGFKYVSEYKKEFLFQFYFDKEQVRIWMDYNGDDFVSNDFGDFATKAKEKIYKSGWDGMIEELELKMNRVVSYYKNYIGH